MAVDGAQSLIDGEHKLSASQLLDILRQGLRRMMRLDNDGLFFIKEGSCIVRNEDD